MLLQLLIRDRYLHDPDLGSDPAVRSVLGCLVHYLLIEKTVANAKEEGLMYGEGAGTQLKKM
jgi:hypothetical protein